MRPSSEPIASQEAQKTYWQKSISLIKNLQNDQRFFCKARALYYFWVYSKTDTGEEVTPADSVCLGNGRWYLVSP